MKLFLITCMIISLLNQIPVDTATNEKEVVSKYDEGLKKIFIFQDKIKDIHPFLKKVYPIAIVEGEHLFIFDTDAAGREYVFIKKAPTPMPMPKGVRATFPLGAYQGKVTCIITGEIFDTPAGYATIFHEFMHCYQFEHCEMKLKQTLDIAQKAMAKNDYMWELNHPFPYEDSKFCESYSQFMKALAENKPDEAVKYRKQLKQILSKNDFEYMVWQEWKEGFARFIENKIRGKLGIEENHGGIEKPFNRITFYEGGARLIELLSSQEQDLTVDIEKLFDKMLNY